MTGDDPFAPLFASDLAQQVRETFEEMMEFGASVTAATQETVHRFEGTLNHEQEGPVVILALAALQVKHREIHASIRDAALELLRSGEADKLVAAEPTARRQVRPLLADLEAILEALEDEEEEDDEDLDDEDSQ